MILARPEKRSRPALSGLDGTALGTYDKAMELLDRKTVLARVRAQRPTFSLKQLKAVIAANPSLRAQHLPLGRSKFGYPAELVDAAIAYVDSADVKRSGGHRHIMTLFSRSHVPASEYRAMIEPRLAPFLETLDRTRQSGEFDEAVSKYIQQCATQQERDYARIALEIIRTGSTMFLPSMLSPGDSTAMLRKKSETILFDRHEQSEQYDVIREVSSVSFPLLFDELFKIVRIISDDEIESSGIVVSHFFKLLTFIVSDTFDVVAQYGKLSPAFQQSEIFRDFDLKTKILSFVVFAIARPYIKTNFEAIVEALPITVGILAAMRRLWPIEKHLAEFLAVEIPALPRINRTFAHKLPH
jgi:hypothetical protein